MYDIKDQHPKTKILKDKIYKDIVPKDMVSKDKDLKDIISKDKDLKDNPTVFLMENVEQKDESKVSDAMRLGKLR